MKNRKIENGILIFSTILLIVFIFSFFNFTFSIQNTLPLRNDLNATDTKVELRTGEGIPSKQIERIGKIKSKELAKEGYLYIATILDAYREKSAGRAMISVSVKNWETGQYDEIYNEGVVGSEIRRIYNPFTSQFIDDSGGNIIPFDYTFSGKYHEDWEYGCEEYLLVENHCIIKKISCSQKGSKQKDVFHDENDNRIECLAERVYIDSKYIKNFQDIELKYKLLIESDDYYVNGLLSSIEAIQFEPIKLSEEELMIMNLSGQIDEQIKVIKSLNLTVEENARIIRNLELIAEEQAKFIQELTTNIEEQAQYINELTTSLEVKAALVNQLQVENQKQAELIKAMRESFTNQGIILDQLNKTIEEDAEIINSLTQNIDEQAEIINQLKLSNQDLQQLVNQLTINNQELQELNQELEKQKQSVIQLNHILLIIIVILISIIGVILWRRRKKN